MVWVLRWKMGSLGHCVCDVTCVATDTKESSQYVYGEGLIVVVVEEWVGLCAIASGCMIWC